MTPALAFELKRCVVVIAVALLAGWAVGDVWPGLALGLAVLLVSQLHGVWSLHRRLCDSNATITLSRGMLGDIGNRVVRLQRQARRRKKRLGKVVTRFQQAAEANPDGSIIIDANGTIEWLNKAAARLLGLRQGRDHGQPIANLIRSPGFATWLESRGVDEALELDSPLESKPRLLLRTVPYGHSKRMLMVRDITRLHLLELMRRDFVANVSHELRSPLTVLVGYLEVMGEDEQLPQTFHRPIAQMTQQSARMTRIVEDLLRLSRIESDPDAAAYTPIKMDELFASLLRDAQRISIVEHVLEHHVERAVLLLGDYNEIYSALSNLVFNAVQYTPAGGRITLTWSSLSNGARFEVCDSGEGIDAHHLPRLTERFYRVDKARSRELGGTGLGLAIVKHVLMRHEAKLSISSTPGKGSVFCCEFPASRVRDVAASPPQSAVDTPAPLTASEGQT